MSISNEELVTAIEEFAEFLELQGDNPYRIKAYRRAAKVISQMGREVSSMVKAREDLTTIPAIGDRIAGLIQEVIEKNDLTILQKKNISRNEPLIIQDAPFTALSKRKLTYRLHNVIPIIEFLIKKIQTIHSVLAVKATGAYRRKCELFNEISILIDTKDTKLLLQKLSYFIHIKSITKKSNEFYIIKLNSGVSINIIITKTIYFPSLLLYQTGSDQHIARLEQIARDKNLKLNRDGIYNNDKHIPLHSELEIYKYMQLEYIPPELREDNGEIERALSQTLPKLITLDDIRGNLHCHTLATDGIETLETMANEAIKYGYEYLAITDHTQSLKITHGLNEKRLWDQIRLIDKLNNRLNGITILKSTEVDILEDGSLDLPNSLLKELDIRVCAIHSKFRLPKQVQTERVLKAMDNPYFNILAHPTGRLIKKREPYEIDMEVILAAARERNCFMEINSQPYRLDINAQYALRAKELGVKISISTDAHSKVGFTYMQYGINQARRGWLEAKDVINTFYLKKLLNVIKR